MVHCLKFRYYKATNRSLPRGGQPLNRKHAHSSTFTEVMRQRAHCADGTKKKSLQTPGTNLMQHVDLA